MGDIDLEAIQARADERTGGWLPWHLDTHVAHLSADVSALVARVRELEAERDAARTEVMAELLDARRRAEKAEQAVARVREAVTDFCHGEQAYAEHAHYCVPVLTALDGGDAS